MDHHHHNARRAGLAAPERARVVPAGLASLGAPGAAPAGLSAPHKDEAHRLAGAAGSKDQDKANTPIVPPSGTYHQAEPATLAEKARAMLAAQLALAGGHVLTELSDGSFMVSRWGHTRHCSDLHAVAQFAKQLGVKP